MNKPLPKTDQDPNWLAAARRVDDSDATASVAAPSIEPHRPTQDDLDAQARERAHEEGQIAIRRLEEASRKAAIEARKQQGLRRAEGVRGILTAMTHAGRSWDQITSDDGNAVWGVVALFDRVAGMGPQPNASENPKAAAAKDSERVLSAAGEKAAGEQFN